MHASMLRNIFCWTMIAVFPASLMAADSGAAMLYAKGTAWLNGANVPRSSAIFPGDLVQDVNGRVQIVARKGDVSVSDGAQTSTLPQGQQTTRDESQTKKKKREGGAAPAAAAGVLDSNLVMGLGAAAVGGLVTWVLLQGDEPASPSTMR